LLGKISIVTDSSSCIPKDRLNNNIIIVPLDLIIEGKTYRDGIDITNQEFYLLLPKLSTIPHTSGAITGGYLEAFKQAYSAGKQILCFTEPARFSAMYNTALIAKNLLLSEYPTAQVDIIECHATAAGLGLVALFASRLSAEGKELEEIKESTTRMMQKVQLLAVLDTLRYLEKSGRVPRISSLANALRIKPIFSLDGGSAQVVALSQSIDKGVQSLVSSLSKKIKVYNTLQIAVMHANNLPMATKLKQKLDAIFAGADIYITEFTPVMGTHTGPGLVGLSFYSD
jgi:DegV family protein with EDD domain